MNNYVIVSGKHLDVFQKNINKLINDGFIPHGNIFITTSVDKDSNVIETFNQAMIKKTIMRY